VLELALDARTWVMTALSGPCSEPCSDFSFATVLLGFMSMGSQSIWIVDLRRSLAVCPLGSQWLGFLTLQWECPGQTIFQACQAWRLSGA
jgi:hypothetical protein